MRAIQRLYVVASAFFVVSSCKQTGSSEPLNYGSISSSPLIFDDRQSYSDLINELPPSPWLNSPNTSEQYFPIFIGATPRELMLGLKGPSKPQIWGRLKQQGEKQVPLLRKLTGQSNFTVQAWPSLDLNGQFNWVFARWRSGGDSWKWLSSDEVVRHGHNHILNEKDEPILPFLMHPSQASDRLAIFGDFLEQKGIYDQPLFGNCVFVDKKSMRIAKAWPNPYGQDRASLKTEFTRRNAYDAYCVNPPAYFNQRPIVLNLEVKGGKLIWPEFIEWLPSPRERAAEIDRNLHVFGWPNDFQARYMMDVKIADGEEAPLLENGKKIAPFTKRGSFQVDNDLERMVDYLEARYKSQNIETERQRFKWRGISQSNLIAKIKGLDRQAPPVIMADHIDAAVAEDIYDKTGERVTTAGADDNSTATSLLLQAAGILKNLKPKRDIWLVHLTGEEFPAVDLGARHFLTEMMRDKKDIYGVIITDFIGWHPPGVLNFQISPGSVKGSEKFAALAMDAAKDLYPNNEVTARYQSRDSVRNSVFQTDLLEFEFRGFPGVLFNEDMDYSKPGLNNPNYHQSTDVAANIDFVFSAKLAKIAIETAVRMAND